MRRAWIALALVAGIASCGGKAVRRQSASPAASGVRALIAALRSDDPGPAYQLLAAEVRRDTPYAEFAALWKQSGGERAQRAAALEDSLKGAPDLNETARVSYPDGRVVSLYRQAGEWRLESALLSRHHAGSPHEAVRLFADALAGRDYEAVVRVLTPRRRAGIVREVDDFTSSLIAHLDGEITFVGKRRAELRWEQGGKRYKVVLEQADGDEWRIDDIDITAVPPEPETPEAGDDD
jgi:hypothetical protein